MWRYVVYLQPQIAVAAVAILLAVVTLMTICYLSKRQTLRAQARAGAAMPMTPKATKTSAEFDASPFAGGAATPSQDQSGSPTRHIDITEAGGSNTMNVSSTSLENGQYLDIMSTVTTSADASSSDITAAAESAKAMNESVDETQPWFAGGMRRTQCENEVANAEHGDFLVRKSRGSDMFVLVVNDNGAPTSFPITRITDEDNVDKYVFGAKLFDNIRGLIKYLRVNPLTGKDGSTLQLQSAAAFSDEFMSSSMLSDISAASSVSSAAGSRNWFVGTTKRSAVEAAVLKGNQGDFLVRESSKGTHYVLCLNDSGSPLSFQIQREGAAFIFTGRAFRSMTSLIEFLRSSPLMGSTGNPVTLGVPAPLH